MANNFSAKGSNAGWRPSRSFSVMAALWFLFLVVASVMGGFAFWLVLFALFLILTALYSLIFGRRSWLGLPHRKGAGAAVGAGVAVLIAGTALVGITAPAPSVSATLADVPTPTTAAATPSAKPSAKTKATSSAKPSAAPTATPSERLVLLAACLEDGESARQGTETVVCTLDDAGVLVWMAEKESTSLLVARAEAQRVAEAKAAAQQAADDAARVAAQQAADDAAWAAAQQAEADRVAAQKAADDAAWAAAQQAEADRVAAEQQAPPIQGFVEAPAAVYYPNCAAARAAGAAPLYLGQPGYRGPLDRDKDGVACE